MIEGSYILTNKNHLRTAMRNLAEQPTDVTNADLRPLTVDPFIAGLKRNTLVGSPESSSSPLEKVRMPNFPRS